MSLWTAAEAARATGGEARGDWAARGVSIDSRTLVPGDLFVALADARDGHDFVAAALDAGAAAAMVSRRPEGVPGDAPLLLVPDVLEALRALGRAARARTGAKVIAVTGSAGKTSTKEMLRAALAGQGSVHAAEASHNNHWGVPLTLARLPAGADFAVVEIGMNHPGEIAPLARLAVPDVAVVTTVAAAHLAAFDDIAGIAAEKAAIFEGLAPGGTAIFPADMETTPLMAAAAARAGARAVTFGEGAGDCRLVGARVTPEGTVAEAEFAGRPTLFRIGAPGRHHARNALAALAAAEAVGADRALAQLALAGWQPPGGRGQRQVIVLDDAEDGLSFELIDDAFNANPASMAAALEVLAAIPPADGVGRIRAGRRIAILGDMLELGADEAALHAGLADLPAMAAVARVHCVGARMRALHAALPEDRRGHWSASAAELAARAHHLVDAGDVILVKGSKGSRVSEVVDALRNLGHPLPEDRGA